MPAVTQVAILFCGQGMSTLIEYYAGGNTAAAPDNLVLIDFGGNQKYSASAVAYVVGKLEMQAAPKFDLVVISHQDGDHLSLLKNLTGMFRAKAMTVTCGGWYAGGAEWSPANKKTVEQFAQKMGVPLGSIAFNGPEESSYGGVADRSGLRYLCRFGNTYIRVLASGLKLTSGQMDIVRNASSSVIVVENGASAIVLPGDATYHTMKVVNNFYAGWGAAPLVPPVFALEVPHHGALRTAVENYSAQTPLAKLDFTIIKGFAANMNARSIVASAGPLNTHCHPVDEVLQVLATNLEPNYGDHTYVSWIFNKPKGNKHDGWYQSPIIKPAVLTTVRTLKPGVVWGDQFFTLTDATSTTPAKAEQRFQPRGFLSDLMDEAAIDLTATAARPDAILRAPAPSGAVA